MSYGLFRVAEGVLECLARAADSRQVDFDVEAGIEEGDLEGRESQMFVLYDP
jgi:hypothetical protein